MKIAQVHLGLLPIPPNGWGAVEKIIWNYTLELRKLGHTVDIRYINEISRGKYDIVHTHVWNHALELRDKEIPYIFTCHDHHAYIHGKESFMYQKNLEAMEYAKLAIVPAPFLISYFDGIPVYLEHGVDLNDYTPNQSPKDGRKLICVGNNGLSGQNSFDRKGFRFAIEAARDLNLPITVVGPTKNNKEFFEENTDLLIPNLKIVYDLPDNDVLKLYQENDILIHATSVEAGHPPLTLLEAAGCGLPILTTDCGGELYTILIKRETEDIKEKIISTIESYDLHRKNTLESVKQFNWENVVSKLNTEYTLISSKNDMKSSALNAYRSMTKTRVDNKISVNFIDGPFVEITGPNDIEYHTEFIDIDTNELVYSLNMKTNTWARTSRKWFTKWKIKVRNENGEIFEHIFDASNKRILISFESSSLGDTIAWIPYVEEFRKKNNCTVIVSTFMNELFESEYKDIQFVKPGTTVDDVYGVYRLGCFYDENGYHQDKHKTDYRKLRLQEIATDILGLDFEEIRPRIHVENKSKQIQGDYVTIGIHSTAQLKYWNNGTGWQDTVDYLNSKGIKTVHISKQVGEFMGNKPPENILDKTGDFSLQERITDILNSKMFIGVSSGLSWVAWALGVPTIVISGCTEEIHEPLDNVYRVINTNVCNSCFSNNYFDKGDWNWCPLLKGTDRQFECSKQIPFSMVQPKIDQILKD
jgi:autotransporter strand-loop-strand O-heptosyltransferase